MTDTQRSVSERKSHRGIFQCGFHVDDGFKVLPNGDQEYFILTSAPSTLCYWEVSTKLMTGGEFVLAAGHLGTD